MSSFRKDNFCVFPFFSFKLVIDLASLTWDDLENDLPDELIPNGGDMSLMGGMPSNAGATPGTGGPGGTPASLGGGGASVVQDAATKHKQLSELLRPTGTGLNSASPQSGSMGSQLGTPLGKSPLGQASPNSRSSPQAQKPGTPTGVAGQNSNNNTAAMCLSSTGFNQALLNNSQGHSGLLSHGGHSQAGQVMNGGLVPGAGRGRGNGVAGMQYQGQTIQGTAPGPGVSGNALVETLTPGAQQMGAHPTLSAAQQAGSMSKVSHTPTLLQVVFARACFNLKQYLGTCISGNDLLLN